ncbi:MAG: hypothetical protein FWH44_01105 [Methanomassiliicoccaceae archaeon]|nr:hypothetical protein [Methanomassiliicoccaceae archaeon]
MQKADEELKDAIKDLDKRLSADIKELRNDLKNDLKTIWWKLGLITGMIGLPAGLVGAIFIM